MIFFDSTQSGSVRHRSGLARVGERLRKELGPAAEAVSWDTWARKVSPADWWLTADLFNEAERPGVTEFLRHGNCQKAAIFHDAIPLKFPQITWPKSVARHPGYLKLLADFDRVWAVSEASRADLIGYWRWAGIAKRPPVEILALGADFSGEPRAEEKVPGQSGRSLLCVGIIEPRKNQEFLLDVCAALRSEGLEFGLDIVGRINPHFGKATAERIKRMAKHWPQLRHHAAADDARVKELYRGACASVFPTIAEGCGLPLLESLWMATPCVCSELAVLAENARGGGCLAVPANDLSAWKSALRSVLAGEGEWKRLAGEAASRPLPKWAGAAKALSAGLST